MSLVATSGFPLRLMAFPYQHDSATQWSQIYDTSNPITVDAAGERGAFVGKVWIFDGSASKTFSSAGGKIHFVVGASAFASASTTLRVGVQDTTFASPHIQPDETFDVYDDLIGGTDTITAAAVKTVTMSNGTKTINNGQNLAVVFHMTARGGSDLVQVRAANALASASLLAYPGVMVYVGGWDAVNSGAYTIPHVLLEFDDGTFGIFAGGLWLPYAYTASAGVDSSSDPDEYGLRFRVPFACTLWGVEFPVRGGTGASGTRANVRLCTGSAASPTLVEQIDLDGYSCAGTSSYGYRQLAQFATPRDLAINTDYMVTWRASSTQAFVFRYITFPANSHLGWLPFGTGGYKVTRNGSTDGTGAFTEQTADVLPVTLLISKLSDNAGGAGGGLLRHPGMSGGLAA